MASWLFRGGGLKLFVDIQELEEGRTHDDLWNAAQLQLVKEGKLHGFLR